MKHPKIMAEIERTRWAITPEALDGLLRAVEQGLTAEDYKIFHAFDEMKKSALVSDLGDPISDTGAAFKKGDNGILFMDGPIVPRASIFTEISGLVSIEELTRDFQTLESDENVKRIVLLIDSPGGDITGISDFSNLIKASPKQNTAFIFGMAASAAFWIATGADTIASTDTGLAGSIGVVITTRRKSDDNSTREFISSQSPLKRVDPDTKAGKESLQQLANDLGDIFVGAVAENRNVSVRTVLSDFGQGALVVARRALDAGMIDSIQTFDSLLKGKPGSSRTAQQNTNTPAIAGTQEDSKMLTLKEMLAENPAIAVEYERAIEASRAEGFDAGKTEAQARVEAAAPFLKTDSVYGAAGTNLALQVLSGKCEPVALLTFAAAMDAHGEATAQTQAQAESGEIEATPPVAPAATGDQVEAVENEATFRAKVDADRKRRGLDARYSTEVN